jgi:hypothetical protein
MLLLIQPAESNDEANVLKGRLLPFVPRLGGLNGKTEGDLARAVEKLKQIVADLAAKFAPLARQGRQFDPPIAGTALGTGDI